MDMEDLMRVDYIGNNELKSSACQLEWLADVRSVIFQSVAGVSRCALNGGERVEAVVV